MPTLSVAVEEAFALTSRVTVVRLREGCGPSPMRGQDVQLAAPGRAPLPVTVTGLEFLVGPGTSVTVVLVVCGAAVRDAPPGARITFEWDWAGPVTLGNADHEPGVRAALRQVLEDEGYQVRTAPDGATLEWC